MVLATGWAFSFLMARSVPNIVSAQRDYGGGAYCAQPDARNHIAEEMVIRAQQLNHDQEDQAGPNPAPLRNSDPKHRCKRSHRPALPEGKEAQPLPPWKK